MWPWFPRFVCRNIRSVGCGFGTHLAIVCADHLLCLGPPLACLDERCLCFHVLWILRHCPLTVFQLMWGISNMMSIIVCLVGSCTRVVMLMLLPAYVGYGSGSRQHCHLWHSYLYRTGSPGWFAGTATGWTVYVWFPVETRDFLRIVQTGCRVHSVWYSMSIMGYFIYGKPARTSVYCPGQENMGLYLHPPCIFMV
jgi:hypothetical protein